MPDKGLCSVEFVLTYECDTLAQPSSWELQDNNQWIEGEDSSQASLIGPGDTVTLGVMTVQPGGTAGFTIRIMQGDRPPPTALALANSPDGNATCEVTPTRGVTFTARQMEGAPEHAIFAITLSLARD
jgi:hypothetical protein